LPAHDEIPRAVDGAPQITVNLFRTTADTSTSSTYVQIMPGAAQKAKGEIWESRTAITVRYCTRGCRPIERMKSTALPLTGDLSLPGAGPAGFHFG